MFESVKVSAHDLRFAFLLHQPGGLDHGRHFVHRIEQHEAADAVGWSWR
jgi:hypothetical protein